MKLLNSKELSASNHITMYELPHGHYVKITGGLSPQGVKTVYVEDENAVVLANPKITNVIPFSLVPHLINYNHVKEGHLYEGFISGNYEGGSIIGETYDMGILKGIMRGNDYQMLKNHYNSEKLDFKYFKTLNCYSFYLFRSAIKIFNAGYSEIPLYKAVELCENKHPFLKGCPHLASFTDGTKEYVLDLIDKLLYEPSKIGNEFFKKGIILKIKNDDGSLIFRKVIHPFFEEFESANVDAMPSFVNDLPFD